MKDYSYLYDLFPLDHSPLRPYPRTGCWSESIYSSLWMVFMHREPVCADDPREINFADVMQNFGYQIEPRHAKIVASIVCWFGTNCGTAFLRESEVFGSGLPSRMFHHRYVLNWTLENMRYSYLNRANRIIELCTNGTDPIELTISDFEAVECLMRWLSTDDGQMFLTLAREECDAEAARQRLKQKAEWMRQQEEWKAKNGC